jgi:Fe-S-cluster-containing hydrogenase component 2
MAGCYECIDRCPDLSIKITDSDIKILENCSNCNACLYICPNSVFYVKNNISEEQNLISSFEDNYYYFCKKTDACLKTEADKKTVNTIECIYAIEDLDIVSAAKKGRKISIITGDCKSCNLRYFHNKKLKIIKQIKEFFKDNDVFIEINIKDFDLSNLEKNNIGEHSRNEKRNSDNEAKDLDRRDFFRNSIKAIKNNAKKIIEDISIEDLPLSELYSAYIDSGGSAGKKINKLFLERQGKMYRFLKENVELLPLFNIKLPRLNENCVFCSNCWELCPTGALTYKEKDGEILLEPFLCTGCNLCKDICSFGAVRMYKAKKLEDISGKRIILERSEYKYL